MTRCPRGRILTVLLSIVATLVAASAASAEGDGGDRHGHEGYSVKRATVNGEEDYLGLSGGHPEFTWSLAGNRRGTKQSAYQIIVSSSYKQLGRGDGDVWNSGRVNSSRTSGVGYGGPALSKRTRYFYAVRSWDDRGKASDWSRPGWLETGIEQGDWTAKWIARDVPAVDNLSSEPDPRTSQLRRDFMLRSREIQRARVYATALGEYVLHLNGESVSRDWFAPGWTDYRDRVQYQTYDVTRLLRRGANALSAELSTGWYAGKISNIGKNTYGSDTPGLLAQLEVTYTDGSREVIATDEQWRTIQGPVVGADHQDGEHYDARLETPGWTRAGFDDSGWEPVVLKQDLPSGVSNLTPQADPPVRVTGTRGVEQVSAAPDGGQIFDLGQNMVGVPQLRIEGLPAGTKITIRFAEELNPDGSLYTANLRGARVTDSYIAGGDSVATWTPRFTFHGFRYIEVTGYPGTLPASAVSGLVLNTAAPETASLQTSDPTLNQLISNVEWSQRSNFLSVPTDCPQRDERMGWTGDINLFAPTAAINMDVRRFLGDKWMADVRDEQDVTGQVGIVVPDPVTQFGPTSLGGDIIWSSATITVPFTVWQGYGETQVLEENWAAMSRFMDYWRNQPEPRTFFGDWAPPGEDPFVPAGPRANSHYNALVALAWFKHDADMMAQMAAALGKPDEAADYAALAQQATTRFQEQYVQPDGTVGVPGHQDQGPYAVALAFDLVPESLREAASDKLIPLIVNRGDGWDLSTGFIGTPQLLDALSDHGNLAEAYTLLQQDDYPSWRYEVNQGATTVWEFWNATLPDGTLRPQPANSMNHYAFGAVAAWMYANIGGIRQDPTAPGYGKIIFQPRPGGGVDHASASLDTVRGRVASRWKRTDHGYKHDVTVPTNATGLVYVPADDADDVLETGDGHRIPAARAEGVRLVSEQGDWVVFEVGSGSYSFQVH